MCKESKRNKIIINDEYEYQYSLEMDRYQLLQNGYLVKKPQRLFKFYNLSLYSVAALSEGYVYAANPKTFNDPFDCSTQLLNDKGKGFNYSNNSPIVLNDIQGVGICSFTEVVDQPVMWAHYASNYLGFVVEFDPKKLSLLLDYEQRIPSIDPVLYVDNPSPMEHTHDMASHYLLTTKQIHWRYEKEYRLLIKVSDENQFDRLVFYHPDSIKSIYFGYKLFEEKQTVFNFLESLFNEKHPNASNYIAHPDTMNMKLMFTNRPKT